MYVTFLVTVRAGLELRERYATRGGFNRSTPRRYSPSW
jgi:hypothetical protein